MHNVKEMLESESSWSTYPKNCLHTCFRVHWFKGYVFVLPDGGHLRFMDQDVKASNDVKIGIIVDGIPEKVSSHVIFGDLVQK